MEVLDLFFGLLLLLLFILGVVLGAFSNILKDLILTPYENWKGKRYIRIENHESLKSLIEGFCSDWELLKCCTIPFVNIRGDLIETSREIYGLIAKNEKDFESDVSDSIREICRKFIVHHHNCRIRVMRHGVTISKGTSIASVEILRKRQTSFDALSGL